jgi:hypothetical protein
MLRYSLFLIAISGTLATAIAAVGPVSRDLEPDHRNRTIIEKNQAFPHVGPLIVEECETEDCSTVSA